MHAALSVDTTKNRCITRKMLIHTFAHVVPRCWRIELAASRLAVVLFLAGCLSGKADWEKSWAINGPGGSYGLVQYSSGTDVVTRICAGPLSGDIHATAAGIALIFMTGFLVILLGSGIYWRLCCRCERRRENVVFLAV
jgi:hypothetical protein